MVNSTEQRFSLIVGAHFYPFNKGIFLQDKKFFGNGCQNILARVNLLAGISIPKPLDNFYFGIGYDFGPGLRLNTGVHLHKYKKYEIYNNSIVDQSSVYKAACPFVSVTIDPSSIIKAIGVFNF